LEDCRRKTPGVFLHHQRRSHVGRKRKGRDGKKRRCFTKKSLRATQKGKKIPRAPAGGGNRPSPFEKARQSRKPRAMISIRPREKNDHLNKGGRRGGGERSSRATTRGKKNVPPLRPGGKKFFPRVHSRSGEIKKNHFRGWRVSQEKIKQVRGGGGVVR